MQIPGAASFRLLRELEANNNKTWYHEHKAAVKERLLEPFADCLERSSDLLDETELRWSGGEGTMFRMYRDVRFSKDKSPYKTEVSGVLTPSGSKSTGGPLIYLTLSATGGFIALGVYKVDAMTLNAIRDHIVEHEAAFLAAVNECGAAGLRVEASDSLKRMPRGFEQYLETEIGSFLRMKDMLVRADLNQKDWKDGQVPERVLQIATKAKALGRFLVEAVNMSP